MKLWTDLTKEEQDKIRKEMREWAELKEKADWEYTAYVFDRELYLKCYGSDKISDSMAVSGDFKPIQEET